MSNELPAVCEIRVPTYRRPTLLKRALLSIVQQTYSHWHCVVFDDCPDGSARSIVDAMQDHRIQYAQNRPQLGAIGNIDQSFAPRAMLGGTYAFILEDDNYLLSNHIERSIDFLTRSGAKVAFCNQYCELVDVAGAPGRIGKDKTLDWMFEPGLRAPDELLPALLFSHGFSNGAVFWRKDCLTDFQIGHSTTRSETQESLRLLRLKEPVYVSLEPTSVWRGREPQIPFLKRKAPLAALWRAARGRIDRAMAEKEKIDYRCLAVERLGVERVRSYVENTTIPDFLAFKINRVRSIERTLLLCGYDGRLNTRGSVDRLTWLLLGYVARHLIPSQLRL
jgi:hypothetical protein